MDVIRIIQKPLIRLSVLALSILLVHLVAQVSAENSLDSRPVATPILLEQSLTNDNGSLTLSKALHLADSANLQLLSGQKNLDLAHSDIRIAKRFPNPQYVGVYTAGKLYTRLSYPQQFGINQLIETAGKRRKRTDVAQAQLELADFQYNSLRWDIRSQVRQAYAELLAARQNAVQIKTQAALLDRLTDITRKRVKAGAAPGAEFYQAELARNQLHIQQNEANGRIEQGRNLLNSLLNNTLPPQFQISDSGLFDSNQPQTEIAPPPSLTMPEKEQLYTDALKSRLDLQSLHQEQKVSQNQLKLTKAQRVPDLLLGVGYQYAITPEPFMGQRFFPGPNVSTTFELPVLHNQGTEIAKLQTTMTQNELRIRDLQRQIKLDVDTAYTKLKTARDNLQVFENELIPEAKKVARLAERGYQVGKTPVANVIIAQQSFQQIIADYTQTIINYQNAWGELEKSIGAPLSAW